MRTSPATMVVVMIAMILCTATLVFLHTATEKAQAEYNVLRQQAAELVAQNRKLSDRIASLGSVDSAIIIAQEELDMVDPDSVIVDPGK